MKVSRLLPEVYYRESRDFSYLGRIAEVAFNYMKTGADSVGVSPTDEDASSDLLELACATVGFESLHRYTKKDLTRIVGEFVGLCRDKGSSEAVERAIRVLLNSQGISETPDVITGDDHSVTMYLPYDMTDVVLLEDLLEYILPAGTLFSIEYVKKGNSVSGQSVGSSDYVTIRSGRDDALGQVTGGSSVSEEDSEPLSRSTLYTGVVTGSVSESEQEG